MFTIMEKSKLTNMMVTAANIIIGQKGILLFLVSLAKKLGHKLSSASMRNSLEPLAITELVVEHEEITAIIINATPNAGPVYVIRTDE